MEVRGLVTLALAGCGRIGFSDVPNPQIDSNIEVVEATGVLDPTFGTGGWVVSTHPDFALRPHGIVARPQGYLGVGILGGTPTARFALVGLTANGIDDAAFGSNGFADVGVGQSDFGYAAKRFDPNRIVIAGDGLGTGGSDDDVTIGIIDDLGVPVESFGMAGFVRLDIAGATRFDGGEAIAIVDGTIVVCGSSGYDLMDSRSVLVRLDAAGNRIASFGANGEVVDDFGVDTYDRCSDVIAVGERLVIAGENGNGRFVVAAYRTLDGARDSSFGTNGVVSIAGSSTRATALVAAGGDIVTVGYRDGTGLVVRLAPDGSPRTAFGASGEVVVSAVDVVDDVVVQPNGKIVAVGTLSGQMVVVRLTVDGALDATFADDGTLQIPLAGNHVLRDAILDPDGALVFTGFRNNNQGITVRVR